MSTKRFLALVLALTMCFALAAPAYADGEQTVPVNLFCSGEHEMGEYEVTIEPTCKTYGEAVAKCKNCPYTETIQLPPEHSFENGVCTGCGAAEPAKKGGESVTLTEETAQARMNGVLYATLRDAYLAALAGGTEGTYEIELLKNAEGPAWGSDKDAAITYSIDFKGHTYAVTEPAVGSTGYETQAVRIIDGQNVTMSNGTITSSDENIKMLFNVYSNLTLNNMVLDGSGLANVASGNYTLSNNKGNIVVNNTTIIPDGDTNDFAFDCWGGYNGGKTNVSVTVSGDSKIQGAFEYTAAASGYRATLTVTGGTFATDPSEFVAAGYEVAKDGANFKVVPEGTAVAEVNGVKCLTLLDALRLAEPGETVKLIANASCGYTGITKDVTIDLNGYKLSAAANHNYLFLVYKDATLTINGAKENSEVFGRINVGNNGNDNGAVVLNGGYYHCKNGETVLHVHGEALASNVTIKNARVESPDDNAIQLNGCGVFLLENSSFTGATGVYIKTGHVTIKNCTITGNMSPVNYSYNGSGANATGDGIVIDACNYPGGDPTVEIVSGTVTGTKAAVGVYRSKGNAQDLGNAYVIITGGTFENGNPTISGDVPTYVYDLTKFVPNGYEVKGNNPYEVVAHQHSYTQDVKISWSFNNGSVSATLNARCVCGAEQATEADVTGPEEVGENLVYTASVGDTVVGKYYALRGLSLSVSVGIKGNKDSYTVGEVVSLTCDEPMKWSVSKDGGTTWVVVSANATSYSFVMTSPAVTNVKIETPAAEEQPTFFTTLTKTTSHKCRFEAGWSMPSGYSIQSASFYRFPSATQQGEMTQQMMLTQGKKAAINLTNQNATYGANLSSNNNNYYYTMLVVTYKDASGAVSTYYSPVQEVAIG